MGLFGTKKKYEGGLTCEAKMKQQLIHDIESKMKEFDINFVEGLLEEVKAKVRSIGDNDELEINSLIREK